MSQFKRRHFLQLTGSTLAAMGLSQLDLLQQAKRYGQVLAQSTPRKLALLVGINKYEGINSLHGCLTDVELQKHLLIHRFGFLEEDIKVVSDNTNLKPTRENILQAFQEHLIKQAKSGDVVVFHYSGHGALVKDPFSINDENCQIDNCSFNGTIVPQDAKPLSANAQEVVVPDIMGRTLFLLTSAIETENITVILDSCHSGASTRGNVTLRAASARTDGNQILVPSPAEIELQQALIEQLGWSEEEFYKRREAGIAKGVAMGSTSGNLLAVDAYFNGGFYAGGFTYLLTRYLWQLTSSQAAEKVYINLRQSTRSLAETTSLGTVQIPTFEYQPGSNFNEQPLFFLDLTTPSAEAVIINAKQKDNIKFWLGGVASQNLKGEGKGYIFSVLNESGQAVAEIQQTSQLDKSLIGVGKQISGDPSAIKEGRLLREKVVGIPDEPKLQLALDESLGADLATAHEMLSPARMMEIVPINQLTNEGYLLGRFTEDYQKQQVAISPDLILPPIGRIGLFRVDFTPNTESFGSTDESIAKAIERLQSTFKKLLANQVLGQVLNTGQGSPLKVQAEISGGGRSLQVASRGVEPGNTTAEPFQVRSGSQLRIIVDNLENQDLYLGVLIISTNGEINLLYPANWEVPEEASRIERNSSLVVPRPGEGSFQVQGTSGLEVHRTSSFPEILLLASKEPLRNVFRAMQRIAQSRGISTSPVMGLRDDEPTIFSSYLLADLENLSSGFNNDGGFVQRTGKDFISYETSTMAVLSAVIEVVD